MTKEMQEEIKDFLNGAGYYNWGIDLLLRLQHNRKDILELEQFQTQTYAPVWAERKMWAILREKLIVKSEKLLPNKDLRNLKDFVNLKPITNNQQPIIQEIAAYVKTLMKERADWHSQMYHSKQQLHRAECAKNILSITKQLALQYALLDNYHTHNILPPQAANSQTASANTAADELGTLISQEKSIAPRISKIKKLIKEGVSIEREAELKREQTEKENILKEIKAKMLYLKK